MAEKCTRSLPPIRVTETLETKLMRLAAQDDRSLSEYVKLVLLHHVDGHAHSLTFDTEEHQQGRASHGTAGGARNERI